MISCPPPLAFALWLEYQINFFLQGSGAKKDGLGKEVVAVISHVYSKRGQLLSSFWPGLDPGKGRAGLGERVSLYS